MIIFIHRR